MRFLKTVTVTVLLICVVLMSTGCGKKESAVCVVGDIEFTEKDMKAYGVMFAQEHGLLSAEDLDTEYEDGITYGQYYKDELKKDVVETLLIYNKAKEGKVSLDKESKKEMKKSVDLIMQLYGKRWFEDNELEKADIERMCDIRALSNQYLNEEMEENGAGTDLGETRYVRLHQVQFMTVKMKDNGLIETNDDGESIDLSEDQIMTVKEEAEDFSNRAQEEKSITISRKEYNAYMSQTENYYKYDDLETEMKTAIDSMKKGDISEAVRFKYGYCVFELLEKDAKEFSQTLSNHELGEKQKSYKEVWMKELRRDMTKEENMFEDEEYWKEFNMKNLIRK